MEQRFKFKCRKCLRCCIDSKIRLSPYDILLLCEKLSLTTTLFHQKYTYFTLDKENQNFLTCMLKTSPRCLFLENKCIVYDARPLGCRVFPLAAQPFYDGKNYSIQYYLLESCPGQEQGKKITLKEYQKSQKIHSEEDISLWNKLKIKAINADVPTNDLFYRDFLSICYDFDHPYFQEFLKHNHLVWPKEIKERYQLILQIANQKINNYLIKPTKFS